MTAAARPRRRTAWLLVAAVTMIGLFAMHGLSVGHELLATGAAPSATMQMSSGGHAGHHAQAVYMAQMAEQHAATGTLKSLAGTVKAAQSPEIAQMSGWLVGWNQPVPSSKYAPGSMGGSP